jgi:nicotinamidase-related amidase
VQGTKGAGLLPELDTDRVDHIVEKGQDKRVEMYSALADPFKSPCVAKSGLADILRKAGVTDVYVVGLAADYCVRYTAIDAQKEGFKTWVVGDATKAVDPAAMDEVHEEYKELGVTVIGKDDAQVQRVKERVLRTQEQGAKDTDMAGESVLDQRSA